MSSFSNINGNNNSGSLVLPQSTYFITFGSMPPVAIAQVPAVPRPLAFSLDGVTPTTINAIPQPVDEDDDDEPSLQLTEQGRTNHVMGEVPKPLPRRRRHSKGRRSKGKTMPRDRMNSAARIEPALVAQPNIPHRNNFFALTESDEERPRRIYARRACNAPGPLQTTRFSNESGRPKSDNPTKVIRQVYQTVNAKPQWRPKRQRLMAQETVPQEIQAGEFQPPRVPVASRLTFPKTSIAGTTIPQTLPGRSVFERLGPKTRTPNNSLMITAPISSQKKRRKAMQVEVHSVYTIETEDTPKSPVEHHTVYMVLPSEGIEEPVGLRTRQQRAKSTGAN